jgi:chromosome segregation ATPase
MDDMDIAERLRAISAGMGAFGSIKREASAEIRRLRALVEELKADRIRINDEAETEIERLEKACAEWAEVSQSNYQRAKAAEAKLAKAVDALHEAWFMLTAPMLNYQPEPEEPGLRRIKDTLAALTGGKDE